MNDLIRFLSVLIVVAGFVSKGYSEKILFDDPLDGSKKTDWKDGAPTFVDHQKFGKAFFFKSAQFQYPTTACWIGDESWSHYRVEYEVLCEGEGGGFIGLDFCVQNDGERSNNIGFYHPKEGNQFAIEHAGRWNHQSAAWKLWPYSPPQEITFKENWMKLRLDVGTDAANVYLNGNPKPAYTIYDLPFSKGGIRFWEYYGSAYYRNLRVTQLDQDSVKPLLDDLWKEPASQNIQKEWEITTKQPQDFGKENIPDALKDVDWKPIVSDRRGIVNLTAVYPDDLDKGSVFAKTIIKTDKVEKKKCWVSYTDRLTVWLNGKQVFQGPARGFYDPGRSPEDGYGRILPDLFQFEVDLKAGENEILLRSELTEPRWGWGFWMRTE